MQVATGTVVGGKLVVEGLDLAEGEKVTVLTQRPEEEVHLSPVSMPTTLPSRS